MMLQYLEDIPPLLLAKVKDLLFGYNVNIMCYYLHGIVDFCLPQPRFLRADFLKENLKKEIRGEKGKKI